MPITETPPQDDDDTAEFEPRQLDLFDDDLFDDEDDFEDDDLFVAAL